MLDTYFKHVEERRAQGIPPLPLNPEDTAEVCRLLEAPPAGEDGAPSRPSHRPGFAGRRPVGEGQGGVAGRCRPGNQKITRRSAVSRPFFCSGR